MANPQIEITVFGADDEEHTIALPAKYEVCPRCEGTGSHVDPNIDGNGLTCEDFDQDPDFEEGYFRGDYDISCTQCHGQRVIAVIDEDRLNAEQRTQWQMNLKFEEDMRRDDASEHWLRMAESGERW